MGATLINLIELLIKGLQSVCLSFVQSGPSIRASNLYAEFWIVPESIHDCFSNQCPVKFRVGAWSTQGLGFLLKQLDLSGLIRFAEIHSSFFYALNDLNLPGFSRELSILTQVRFELVFILGLFARFNLADLNPEIQNFSNAFALRFLSDLNAGFSS